MTERQLRQKYPHGYRVQFADSNVTPQGGKTVIASGFIIGEAWESNGAVWVPVWSRHEGLGPTTVVHVRADNILDVVGPPA